MLALATAAQLFRPGLPFVVLAPELDYVVNTAAMLIAGAVGLLAWIRHRETNEPDVLYQASAFFVLSLGGAIGIVLLVSNIAAETGFDRAAPGQAPLYLWTVQRLLAAVLLLAGAAAALRRWARGGRARTAVVAIVPPSALVAISAVVLLIRRDLPVLLPPDDLARIVTTTDVLDLGALSPSLAVVQLALAGLFTAAVVAYFFVHRREGGRRPYVAFLSLALVFAAFSQVHFAIVPGSYTDLLTSGDVLRLSFYSLLGLGVVAGWRQDLHDLREANADLRRLRSLDAERAALEERARITRDIHDGLVQELWLARLTQGGLLQGLEQEMGVASDMAKAARRVDSILEDALSEARQAVVTLQPQRDDGFGGLLVRIVEDYAERFGLDVECEIPREPIAVSQREQGEIIRICREALNNARKHANSALVRLTVTSDEAGLEMTVSDDGIGFDPNSARSGFGLRGMRERAATLGGSLHVESAPGRGVRVTFHLPSRR